MICEFMMRPRQIEFGHVARSAAVRGHLTHPCPRPASPVTGLALGIVIEGVAVQLVVRVMTSQATDPWVIHVVALASGQPVRLETDIVDIEPTLRDHGVPSAVALSTKVGYFLRGHF